MFLGPCVDGFTDYQVVCSPYGQLLFIHNVRIILKMS